MIKKLISQALFLFAMAFEVLAALLFISYVLFGRTDMFGGVTRAAIFAACAYPYFKTNKHFPLVCYWLTHCAVGLPLVIYVFTQTILGGLVSFSFWLIMLLGALGAWQLMKQNDPLAE